MFVPIIAAFVVHVADAYPKPLTPPPRMNVKLNGTKPQLRVKVVPNQQHKKHLVVRPAEPNPNA